MPERVVSGIPRVVMKDAKVIREYGVLLTDVRSIFVYGSKEHMGDRPSNAVIIGGALGGMIGASIARALTSASDAASPPPPIDFSGGDVESLARDRKNIVISHASLRRIEVVKRFGEYVLSMEYLGPKGRPVLIEASLVPSQAAYEQGKAAGKVGIEIAREYARYVEGAYMAALPPAVADAATWEI